MHKKIRLGAIVDEFIKYQIDRGLSLRYTSYYRDVSLKRLLEFCGRETKLHRLNESNLRSFAEYLKTVRKISQNSRRRYLLDVKMLLKYAQNRNYKSPSCELVQLPRRQAARPRNWITHSEFQYLVGFIDTGQLRGVRDRALIEMLYATGMRISECLALKTNGINLDTKRLTIIGKGGRTRLVFLSDEAAIWLEKWLNHPGRTNEDGHLWYRFRPGGPYQSLELGYASVYKILRTLASQAGLRHISPHSLRHSFATNLLQSGADIRSVQTLLGHAQLATTEIYTHISDKHLEAIYRRHHPSNHAALASIS